MAPRTVPADGECAGTDNSVGSTPGVGIIEVRNNGRSGAMLAVAPMTNPLPAPAPCAPTGGQVQERADGHGIAVRTTTAPDDQE